MLHSLAHLLITEAALDCGYGASAIKERIYAFDDMVTASFSTPEAAVQKARSVGWWAWLIASTNCWRWPLERAALCSNDPFCASHEPNSDLEKRYAHGAACHGCLLIAETSCERRNEFLDRALVVPTLIQHDAAFFTDGP